tara:strand:- start:350 stop:568 length:219 start_codon:yes stop_codon:yes gene_type:complete
MTEEYTEIRRKTTDLFGHLEAACNAAHALMQLGFMDNYTYEQMFNGQIAQMEGALREIRETRQEEMEKSTTA